MAATAMKVRSRAQAQAADNLLANTVIENYNVELLR